VYVYRDDSATAHASPRRPAEDDAAYWYDLVAEEPGPQREEARGPFEPLQPSGGPFGGPSGGPSGGTGQAPPDTPGTGSQEAPEQTRARKLEQLKDLYLTAEAIGEQNVDKHFDQLLAQQRELISEYFSKSAPASPDPAGPGVAELEHRQAGTAGGQATPPEGVSVRAEPPRAW
jgi:hypothetical protein